jgi:hypothetical protein
MSAILVRVVPYEPEEGKYVIVRNISHHNYVTNEVLTTNTTGSLWSSDVFANCKLFNSEEEAIKFAELSGYIVCE